MKRTGFVLALFVCMLFCWSITNAQQSTGTPSREPATQESIDGSDKISQQQQQINSEAAKVAALDKQKQDQAIINEGYLLIPGFTLSGDKQVDAENYERLKGEFKKNNPAAYEELLNSSGGGN